MSPDLYRLKEIISLDGHSDCLKFRPIRNKACMNIQVHTSLSVEAFLNA